jgi:WD40 repeat protein
VGGIVFSPDGRTLAVGSEDGDVRLWDLQTRPRLRRRLHARGPVRAVAFGPGGRTVVAIDDRANVLLWDARRGTLLARLRAPAGGLPTLALSADGRTLAAATVGSSRNPLNVPKGRVRVWDVPSRTVLGTIRIETLASALALAPDGDMLAVGGSFDPDPNRRLSNPEGQLQLWHAHSLRPASRKLHLKSFVDALAFRDRGHVLLGGLDDGSISAWAVPTLAPVGRPRRAFSHPVTGIAVARSGRTAAAAASGYGTVEVWDPRGNGGFGLAIRPDYKYALFYALAFSPDGRTVVAGGSVTDGVQAVRVASGAPATSYPSTGRIQSLAFTAGGSKLAGGTDGGYVRLWDTARGRRDGRRLGNCECGVSIVVVDGDTLAAAGDNGTIRLWSVARRRPNGPTLSAPLDQPVAATFLDGGKTFATVGFDGSVRLWDIARGRLRRPPLHIIPGAAAFGPDGHTVAIGGNRGVIWLWDLRPPAHGVPLPDALPDAVTAVGFSPDGRTIAAASERGLVRLWDVPSRTAVGLTLRTGDLLNALAFSPDGTVLAAAGSALRIWNGILWRGDVAGLRREVCGLVGGGLSRGEWALAAPRLAFRETCPG